MGRHYEAAPNAVAKFLKAYDLSGFDKLRAALAAEAAGGDGVTGIMGGSGNLLTAAQSRTALAAVSAYDTVTNHHPVRFVGPAGFADKFEGSPDWRDSEFSDYMQGLSPFDIAELMPFDCIALEGDLWPDELRGIFLGRSPLLLLRKSQDARGVTITSTSISHHGSLSSKVRTLLADQSLLVMSGAGGCTAYDTPLSSGDNRNQSKNMLFAAMYFLTILNCSNVSTEIRRSAGGRKKGKTPLCSYTYHTLVVDPQHERVAGAVDVMGERRGPREHLRRGHIRRYSTGKSIWVNSSVVNQGTTGRIEKDYRVAAT